MTSNVELIGRDARHRKSEIENRKYIPAYIGLGSNLGEREETIRQALRIMDKTPGIRVGKVSTLRETKPAGVKDQPDFINGAAAIETSLAPLDLLDALQAIETKLGRVRDQRWGPRTIDLDILFYGDKVIRDSHLSVPHPGLEDREFLWDCLKDLRE